MAYPLGFTYVKGPIRYLLSTISSTCTVKARNPVSLTGLGRTIVEASSTQSSVWGIATHDAADSIYPGKMLVEIPTEQTIYATQVQTGVAASALSAGQAYAIEKSGNYIRLDADSQVTAKLLIVPRDDGSTVDSNDSSVFVSFLGNMLILGSNSSTSIY